MKPSKLRMILDFVKYIFGPKKNVCDHGCFVKSFKLARDIGITPNHYRCEKCSQHLKPTGWIEE